MHYFAFKILNINKKMNEKTIIRIFKQKLYIFLENSTIQEILKSILRFIGTLILFFFIRDPKIIINYFIFLFTYDNFLFPCLFISGLFCFCFLDIINYLFSVKFEFKQKQVIDNTKNNLLNLLQNERSLKYKLFLENGYTKRQATQIITKFDLLGYTER